MSQLNILKNIYQGLCLILIFAFFTSNLIGQEEPSYELLWKIEKDGITEPSFLFGTMHVQDERAFNFSDSVMISLESCNQFAMEIHPDTMMNAIYDQIFNKDTTNYFKEYLSEEDYQKFITKFEKEKGYQFEELENKSPLVLKSLTKNESSLGKDRGTFVDMFLYGIAKTYEKSIHGLEHVDNQLGNLKESAFQEIQLYLNDDSLNMRIAEQFLADTYKTGDIDEMEKFLGNRMLGDSHFIKRNQDMASSLVDLIHEAPTFAAVGAAHLIGENSIIAMLEEKGFTVKKVEATFTGVADSYKIDPSKFSWHPFVNQDAGVILSFPVAAKYLKRSFPHPDNVEYDSSHIHMWISSDLANLTNYLFAYNDFPSGYFVEDIDEVYQNAINEVLATSERLSPTTKVYKDGIEGRQLDVNVRKTTYARLQIFIRGNRVYKFLVQNLNQGEQRVPESEFLEKINFLPFKTPALSINTEASDFIDFLEFSNSIIVKDTVVDYSSFTNQIVSYFTTNSKSGGTYVTVVETLRPYYRAESLDSFYNEIVSGLQTWQDTLIHKEQLQSNGTSSTEWVLKKKEGRTFSRYRLSLIGDKLLLQSAYLDSTEIWSPAANQFFDGLKVDATKFIKYDLLSSKTENLLLGLQSEDSIAYNTTYGALENYYVFKNEDIPYLKNALEYHYPNDTNQYGVVSLLLKEISLLEDSTLVNYLKDLYKNNFASTYSKCDLLESILELKDTIGYLDLFFDDTPNKLSNNYTLMAPFSDSVGLATEYFDKLLPLVHRLSYREDILDLSYTMTSSKNEDAKKKISENYGELIAFRDEDLLEYKKENAIEDNYFWPSKIRSYLSISEYNTDDQLEQFLIDALMIDSTLSYLNLLGLQSRFSNDFEVKQSDVDSLLKDNFYTYELILAASNHDKWEYLPDSLYSDTIQVSYKAKENLYDDNVECISFEFLGKTEINTNQFYVFNFSDEYYHGDKDNNWLIMVGNFEKDKPFSIADGKAFYFEIGKDETQSWKDLIRERKQDYDKYAY